jgi:hypothetical protein
MRLEVTYHETHNHDIIIAPPVAFKSVPEKGTGTPEGPD